MSVNPIPTGCHSVTPYLVIKDAVSAIEFYKSVFGAEELMRMEMQPGVIGHAELRIGDSIIMLSEEFVEMGFRSPLTLGGTPVSLMIYIPDAEEVFVQALTAGAQLVRPVMDQFYGDRSGMLTDPYGHVWTIATHIEDVAPDEMKRRMDEFLKENPMN
ncbi:MAG: VOC family protein [Planctomycetota bacterium]|nr:MAG: VOC family protein [Planctomycetota bacterium]